MEDSEYESDGNSRQEYLMSTRQRRTNAGNKMKKLLEQELEEMQSKTENINDDNLDLLFQEDDDDDEFEVEQDSSEAEDSEEPEGIAEETIVPTTEGDDMLLSDSEDESSAQEDDDTGERELQQEKILQRKRRRKNRAPVIKKKSKIANSDLVIQSKRKVAQELLNAESLLVSDRRTSKRSSVMANKLEVYEKLSRAEKKRKIIQERIKKHRELQKEEVLTQEDRMRIALETEKFNLLSLNKYKEQEISKKQSRLAMQKRQKIKFKPGEIVVQEISTAWKVDLIMELEDKTYWDEQLRKREKKKKKYPRRQKKPTTDCVDKDDSKISEVQQDGSKVTANAGGTELVAIADVADVADKMKDKNFLETPAKEEKEESGTININSRRDDQTIVQRGISNDEDPQVTKLASKIGITNIAVETGLKSHCSVSESLNDIPGSPKNSPKNNSQPLNEDDTLRSTGAVSDSLQTAEEEFIDDVQSLNKPDKKQNGLPVKKFGLEEGEANPEGISAEEKKSPFSETEVLLSNLPPLQGPINDFKSNADEIDVPDLIPDFESEGEVFQGPLQLVAKNFVTLLKFPGEQYNGDIRNELFGRQWANATRQRSPTVETLCKISMPENAVLSVKETSIVPDLSFLENFPAFGEYGKKFIHDTGAEDHKELEVEIKTQPPAGVLFTNGVRKRCLITNKECQYFDPRNGVPYSDVEAYKVIQEIQDSSIASGSDDTSMGHYKWFGFRNGGIYLDSVQRPAKNVPTGF